MANYNVQSKTRRMINPTTDRILDSARIALLRKHGYVVDDMLTIINPVTRISHKVNVYSDEGMFHVKVFARD